MKKPWFGVHRFWGWYPISWQGYAVISVMFLAIIYIMVLSNSYSQSISDTLILAFPFICLIISTTILTALVTGQKPEFGHKNKGSKSYSPDNPEAYLFLALLSLPIALYYLINKGYVGTLLFLIVFYLIYQVYLKFKSFQ